MKLSPVAVEYASSLPLWLPLLEPTTVTSETVVWGPPRKLIWVVGGGLGGPRQRRARDRVGRSRRYVRDAHGLRRRPDRCRAAGADGDCSERRREARRPQD